MLRTLKNALKVKDIRNKILFTLAVLLVYRLGTLIAVPGVNAKALQSIGSTGLISLLDTVSGGGLAQYSIFSMGGLTVHYGTDCGSAAADGYRSEVC